jgi:alpha-ketoglutarate-dependent taurine dioxygenase
MSFAAEKIKPLIGARIIADKETLLGKAGSQELRDLLDQRGVIVLPYIEFTDDEQLAFSQKLGDIIEQGTKGVLKISLDEKVSETAGYLQGTVLWHIDGFSDDLPTRGSILSARTLSAIGGQTEFANTYAAYESLPEVRKAALAKIKVVHTMEASQRDVYPDPSPQMKLLWDNFPPRTHPLVWTHRSGRKSLVLSSSADHIVGMERDEGRALLAELLAWSTQPQFVYRHEWNVGDTVIWDNYGVMHRVEPYPADSGRLMHRTTLVGEESIVA